MFRWQYMCTFYVLPILVDPYRLLIFLPPSPSQLAPETAIISLVYINRVMAYTNLALHASTWRRVVLGAVVLACKVWDDLAGKTEVSLLEAII